RVLQQAGAVVVELLLPPMLRLDREAGAVEDLPAPALKATFFNGPLTWRGTPQGTSMSPMATATLAWPSSTRTASSSSPGAREDRSQVSSTRRTGSRSMRRALSTSP